MGKITVNGHAEKKVNYDIVVLKFSFVSKGNNSSKAIQDVRKQTETFLSLLKEQNVDISQINFEEDNLNEKYNDYGILNARRELSMRIPYNMDFINYINDLIEKNNFDVRYDMEFELSNKESVHKELLKAAMIDAKEKAELIAESLGKRVVKLKSASTGACYDDMCVSVLKLGCMPETFAMEASCVSRDLQAPSSTEDESVTTVWLLEDL